MSAEPRAAEAAIGSALQESEQVRLVRGALAGLAGESWIVGGTIRDAILGRPLADIDIATSGSAREAARAIAAAPGAGPTSVFELSDRFETWRVGGSGSGWTVDVAALRGGEPSAGAGIEADLALRDFTVNAIAVPLKGGAPIDPSGGLPDLEGRRLRAVSGRSFSDDPLRALRGARIGAELGLEPDAATVELARAIAPRAAEPAGERRFSELRLLLGGADPLRGLELLERFGLTGAVLRPFDALHGVSQSANHHLDVYEHTIEVLRRWLAVEADLERYVGAHAAAVASALAEPLADGATRRDGIRFAAILHDIGKPPTRTEHDGRVGFRGHDAVGAELVTEFCRELRTSRRFGAYLAALTRHHLVLGFMVAECPLSRRRIWDYLTLCGPEALDVTLLTIADRLSAQGTGVPAEAITGHLELAREMVGEILALQRDGVPEPLLGGAEIAELLGLEPGPRIGSAKRELAAAQFAGEVDSPERAAEHLRDWQRQQDD